MPIPLPNPAPYDTLATVTELTRALLADFIQGIVPNLSGTVNTNGLAVTSISGNQFTALLNNVPILINGLPNTVALVTSPLTLQLINDAGVQANVPFSAVLPTGDIFADAQAYVLPTVNLAWRKLQEKLADKGHPRARNEIDILGLPISTDLDPISQQYLSWEGFFDGTELQPAPNLPQDFLSPLQLYERLSGIETRFRPMHPAANGLRSTVKGSYNRYWDWREDALYFNGAMLPLDLRIRYVSFLPDLVPAGGGFGSTPVPILRAAKALAYYTAEAFVEPRGSTLAPSYAAKGDAAVDQMTNAWAKLQQRASFSRRAWGERGRRAIRTGQYWT